MKWFHSRIHEPVAFSSVLAVSLSLHIAWIANVLVYRVKAVEVFFTLHPGIGPVSGLYSLTICSFLLFWFLFLLIFRGRDISHLRERVFWFFVTSIILFFVMTMPVVYQVGVIIE